MGIKGNALFAQSGGPTAVINSSISGAIMEASKHNEITAMYGSINGILGVLNENMIDLNKESKKNIELLRVTPSSALGSSRHKIKNDEEYEKLLKVMQAHDIRYFFLAGGNDSMDTANKVHKLAVSKKYDLKVMGLPKTVDNDLPVTDHCPGFGSVARWLALAVRDAGLDTEAIYTADTIKVVETMGRNAGWITASTVMARQKENDAPHIILLPEVPFIQDKFLATLDKVYKKLGYAVISCCEGLKDEKGEYLTSSKRAVDTDRFGHKQLGGVGETLVSIISENLKIKARCDKPGTIQRVAGIAQSKVDQEEAYTSGAMAVKHAVEGKSGLMVTLVRESDNPYKCTTGVTDLGNIANKERKMPAEFISEDGMYVSDKFIKYITPLIGGALPEYARLEKHFIAKKLLK
ncbi:MAG: 6-phosphofructokinase [Candidatus Firestonebacteria bacterium]|nr:6-phosphofructokinase [Candidatus Firestonebacteria bacterium]